MPIVCGHVVRQGTTGHNIRCGYPVKWVVVDHHRIYAPYCAKHWEEALKRAPLNDKEAAELAKALPYIATMYPKE